MKSLQAAVETPEKTLSYPEFHSWCAAVANELKNRGVSPGDLIAFCEPNDWKLIVLFFAAFRIRAVVSPLNTRIPPEGLRRQRARLGKHHWFDHDAIQDLFEAASRALCDASPWDERKTGPAALLFTSGSTGNPKAALLDMEQLVASAEGANQAIPLGPSDRWLLTLPLFHVGGIGILFRCILSGATIVLPTANGPITAEALSEKNITHLSAVPTQLFRLLGANSSAPLSLKWVLLGGAAASASLLETAQSLGWPVRVSYGLTETASVVTASRAGEISRGSGRALPGREIRISDTGEILVRGKTLFSGYFDHGVIHRPLTPDGWYRTGDLGKITPNGDLEVLGRIDNLFISGGENVHPEEVENALSQLSGIEQVAVVAVPSPEFGARPIAFVRSQGDPEELTERWKSELSGHLPKYKIPLRFFPWPEGPETAGLKPDRKRLTALAERLISE